MATKMKRLSLHLRTFLLMIWACLPPIAGYSCPYGAHNCRFEPAPRGSTPPCAQPGLTYCTDPDPYPEQLIRRLIEAGQYDIRTLLMDESRDDFSAKKNDYPYGYGPNSLPNVDQISLVNENSYNNNFENFNPDIFSQKTPLQPPSPVDPTPYNINTYQATNYSKFGYNGYHNGPSYWTSPNPYYEKKAFRQNGISSVPHNLGGYNPNLLGSTNVYSNFDSAWFRHGSSAVTQYNPNEWWKYISPSRSDAVSIQRSVSFPPQTSTARRRRRRNAELVKASKKKKLSGAEALRIALGLANEDESIERSRRQTGGEQLCGARTRFVTPRAALNNQGNWMYVVNMPADRTQLVRAETCASAGSECKLCSLPFGYSSKCEQKFIQKRLVALKPEGDNLYTDLFWIPSCCQCSINKT